MDSKVLFAIILAVLVFDFILERVLEYLNASKMGQAFPEELKGLYDEEKYKTQQSYERENHRFKLITGTFSFAIILSMIFYMTT